MTQPGRGEVECRLTIGKRANHARASPDLAQDALERIVGTNPTPVFLGKAVVGERLLNARFRKFGGPDEAQAAQLLDPRMAFSRAAARSSLAWIALSMAAISRSRARD